MEDRQLKNLHPSWSARHIEPMLETSRPPPTDEAIGAALLASLVEHWTTLPVKWRRQFEGDALRSLEIVARDSSPLVRHYVRKATGRQV